ncbi:tRNA (Uracil-5-)-methyltransferase fused to TRAM domain [Fictibacillus macauensis ZFHKF-1]|uniref:tRNA (Uracil-5-)-methyltransferase fused to TRAM domain n=1 Tax=Fictibacillus macauensis ZFHKF-1 TaxID=1196324 RepID=I8AG87_9BACL|nr:23S rRNA (uracil(1939)-C(5))-methyltransferase RlmD [Fictibacillus macauensis]EIT84682.1 tRNA (Uracil-5-)-methyltransferase fused to TRAM domain [Fictibacillus macauensis ZFHKF-1]
MTREMVKAPLKIGQTLPLSIKRLGINGEGIGFYKRTVVFVPGALPGEEITVSIQRVFPNRAEGTVVDIKKKSPQRVVPPCPIYEECGGCQLQHLSYHGQLKEKKDIVRQAFERYTNIKQGKLPLKPTIGMDKPFEYRNKSQLPVAIEKGKVIAGLYRLNTHRLIDLDQCLVQHPQTVKVTNVVKRVLQDLKVPIYHEKKNRHGIRTIVVRTGFETGQTQLVLVTADRELPRQKLLVQELTKRLQDVTSIVQNVNSKKTSLVFGDETIALYGPETIKEKLGELSFDLSARAFFQLNPEQTVTLYDEAKKAANLTGKEKVVDAYCGAGTIGLWLAPFAAEVRGMDVIEESVRNAKENAERQGFTNTHYETGKAEVVLPKWAKEGFKPDVIVVDPPRTGCDDAFLKTASAMKPKRLVYVSCNPSTLAKDVDTLMKNGFEVESITPVDMFPQTAHVEVVCALTYKG